MEREEALEYLKSVKKSLNNDLHILPFSYRLFTAIHWAIDAMEDDNDKDETHIQKVKLERALECAGRDWAEAINRLAALQGDHNRNATAEEAINRWKSEAGLNKE